MVYLCIGIIVVSILVPILWRVVLNYSTSIPMWFYLVSNKSNKFGLVYWWVNSNWDPEKCSREVNLRICKDYSKFMLTRHMEKFIVELDEMGKIDWSDLLTADRLGKAGVKNGLWRKFPEDFVWFEDVVKSIPREDLALMVDKFGRGFIKKLAWYYPLKVWDLKNLIKVFPEFGSEDNLYRVFLNGNVTDEVSNYVNGLLDFMNTPKIPEDAVRLADDLWLKDGKLYSGVR